jgi:heme exporter protein A
MLEARALSKSFGHSHALRGVDLRVETGRVLTVVGPNGAGKTTLLRVLATLVRPTAGWARLDGLPLDSSNGPLRSRIGFLSDHPIFYGHLTVEENLRFYGRLFGLSDCLPRIDRLLDSIGLAGRRHDLARKLSRGLQQRLSLARCLLHRPSLLLLDEPFAGLDQEAVGMLHRALTADGVPERTVVMATHNLEQGLDWCDDLVILSEGRVVFQGESAGLHMEDLLDAYRRHAGPRQTPERVSA